MIDESGIPKKGTKSAGVAPQYCGVRHAVVNCQSRCLQCYVSGRGMALVDRELYLPAVWTTDRERCQAAAVPESVGFATKPQLPVGMLARLLGRLPAAWWPRMVDRRGIPLAACLSAANTHDSMLLEAVVDAVPPIKGRRGRPGRPRRRPVKLHGDKGYDYPRCRRALRRRGITPRIARRGIDPSRRLGRHRYVVERSLAWLVGYRRLQVRYERRADVLLGLVYLACALICLTSQNR